jgi:hypothetical protein
MLNEVLMVVYRELAFLPAKIVVNIPDWTLQQANRVCTRQDNA